MYDIFVKTFRPGNTLTFAEAQSQLPHGVDFRKLRNQFSCFKCTHDTIAFNGKPVLFTEEYEGVVCETMKTTNSYRVCHESL